MVGAGRAQLDRELDPRARCELVGVQPRPQPGPGPGVQDGPGLVGVERAAVAEDVHPAGVRGAAAEHLAADQGDVVVGPRRGTRPAPRGRRGRWSRCELPAIRSDRASSSALSPYPLLISIVVVPWRGASERAAAARSSSSLAARVARDRRPDPPPVYGAPAIRAANSAARSPAEDQVRVAVHEAGDDRGAAGVDQMPSPAGVPRRPPTQAAPAVLARPARRPRPARASSCSPPVGSFVTSSPMPQIASARPPRWRRAAAGRRRARAGAVHRGRSAAVDHDVVVASPATPANSTAVSGSSVTGRPDGVFRRTVTRSAPGPPTANRPAFRPAERRVPGRRGRGDQLHRWTRHRCSVPSRRRPPFHRPRALSSNRLITAWLCGPGPGRAPASASTHPADAVGQIAVQVDQAQAHVGVGQVGDVGGGEVVASAPRWWWPRRPCRSRRADGGVAPCNAPPVVLGPLLRQMNVQCVVVKEGATLRRSRSGKQRNNLSRWRGPF